VNARSHSNDDLGLAPEVNAAVKLTQKGSHGSKPDGRRQTQLNVHAAFLVYASTSMERWKKAH
jgi:hypothetical protein